MSGQEGPPRTYISGGQPFRKRVFLGESASIVFPKVLKREKRVRNTSFGPVEKTTVLQRDQDISGVEINVPKSIRKFKPFEQAAGFLQTASQERELGARKGLGS